MLAIACVGALAAVLTSGAPTGIWFLDGIYRALFVVVLTYAGSRARRWGLILASAVAAAGSLGIGLLIAFVAFATAVALVGANRRNRVAGALVGALTALALLRLQIHLFDGLSALVAAVAASVLVGSTWKVLHRSTKRMAVLLVSASLGVLLVGAAISLSLALTQGRRLQSAATTTQQAVDQVRKGHNDDAASLFADAGTEFAAVEDTTSAWWSFPARLLPGAAHNLRAVSTISSVGRRLTDSAADLAANVSYDRLRRSDGGIDLDRVKEYAPRVADADRVIQGSLTDVDAVDSPWLLPQLSSRLQEFNRRVSQLADETELADVALAAAPGLLGSETPRVYLVLLGNPAEARDLGGHIGNWAQVTVSKGRMTVDRVGLPGDLTNPSLEAAVAEDADVPASTLALQPAVFPQNWGASLDFGFDAQLSSRLYKAKTQTQVDGVIYADPYAMKALLASTGPITVEGLSKPISADDAVTFLTRDQYSAFTTGTAADKAVTDLVDTALSRFAEQTLPSPKDLGDRFAPLVKAGRLRMITFHPSDAALLGRTGLSNRLVRRDGEDLVAVVSRNANPSKIDAYMRRSSRVNVQWDPASGTVESDVTVTVTNTAPESGLPAVVLDNSFGLPDGTNVSDLALITPFEVESVDLDGAEVAVNPQQEGGLWRHTVRLQVPPGATQRLTFHLSGAVTPGRQYRVRVGTQPLLSPNPTTVRVRTRTGTMVGGTGIRVDGSAAEATLRGIGTTVVTLRVDF
ncbi:MAG: DUF4012 domain-containing protein [Microthrixaceae bacterium]